MGNRNDKLFMGGYCVKYTALLYHTIIYQGKRGVNFYSDNNFGFNEDWTLTLELKRISCGRH